MTLRNCILRPYSDHNFVEMFSMEPLEYTYQTAWCPNQEYHSINFFCSLFQPATQIPRQTNHIETTTHIEPRTHDQWGNTTK